MIAWRAPSAMESAAVTSTRAPVEARADAVAGPMQHDVNESMVEMPRPRSLTRRLKNLTALALVKTIQSYVLIRLMDSSKPDHESGGMVSIVGQKMTLAPAPSRMPAMSAAWSFCLVIMTVRPARAFGFIGTRGPCVTTHSRGFGQD